MWKRVKRAHGRIRPCWFRSLAPCPLHTLMTLIRLYVIEVATCLDLQCSQLPSASLTMTSLMSICVLIMERTTHTTWGHRSNVCTQYALRELTWDARAHVTIIIFPAVHLLSLSTHCQHAIVVMATELRAGESWMKYKIGLCDLSKMTRSFRIKCSAKTAFTCFFYEHQ